MKSLYEINHTEIRITKNFKNLHPVVESIANNLSEIDVIHYIRISAEMLQASSETTGGCQKNPVTKPGHPSAVGVSLILDTENKEIQFFEITSAEKGYGEKMVKAVLNCLPEEWSEVYPFGWTEKVVFIGGKRGGCFAFSL